MIDYCEVLLYENTLDHFTDVVVLMKEPWLNTLEHAVLKLYHITYAGL